MYDYINYKPARSPNDIFKFNITWIQKIEIRDHGICNHIKRDITLSLVGIDLFLLLLREVRIDLVVCRVILFSQFFLHFSCSFFNGIYSNIVKGDMTLLCLV